MEDYEPKDRGWTLATAARMIRRVEHPIVLRVVSEAEDEARLEVRMTSFMLALMGAPSTGSTTRGG